MFEKIFIDDKIEYYLINNIHITKYFIGILILTYNRQEYLDIMLSNFKKSILNDVIIIIIDDGSNEDTIKYIKKFNIPNIPIIKIFKKKNYGIGSSIELGWKIFKNLNIKFICNLDSDVYIRHDWLTTLKETYIFIQNNYKSHFILSGFNYKKDEYKNNLYFKTNFMGGINMFFNDSLLNLLLLKNFYDDRWDINVTNFMNYNNYNLFITSKCVIQHIGLFGTNSRMNNTIFSFNFLYDVDENFYFKPIINYIDSNEINYKTNNIEELKNFCLKDEKFVGFSTDGFMKQNIKLNYFKITNILSVEGTYIKKSYFKSITKYIFNK